MSCRNLVLRKTTAEMFDPFRGEKQETSEYPVGYPSHFHFLDGERLTRPLMLLEGS